MLPAGYNEDDGDYFGEYLTFPAKLSVLEGKTLIKAEKGKIDGEDYLLFVVSTDEQYIMYHKQECCENVYIEDVCGNLDDLVGAPLLMVEEATNYDKTIDEDEAWQYTHVTWVFYKFATIKGYVTVRWYGSSSNGWYSDRAGFYRSF